MSAAARLSTSQRRLRHLTELVGRNLARHAGGSRGGSSGGVAFTLHADGGAHYYSSENPSWAPFSSAAYADGVDLAGTALVVRVWWVPDAHPPSTANGADATRRVLLEWVVDLRGLVPQGEELKDLVPSTRANELLFRVNGLWFGLDPCAASAANGAADGVQPEYKLGLLRADKSRVVQSYNEAALATILVKLRVLLDVRVHKQALALELDKRMALSGHTMAVMQLHASHRERRDRLAAELERVRSAAAAHRASNEQRLQNLRRRSADLDVARERLGKQTAELRTIATEIQQNREILRQTHAMVRTRRALLLRQLQEVFQLRVVKAVAAGKGSAPLVSIMGVLLPNVDYQGCDEEQIATALGWTSQVVLAMAVYCDVPLIFTINPVGSRSTIREDGFSNAEFPLYSKGVERSRFEKGVFLLNKSIEQLLMARGPLSQDVRNTLPNLLYLLEQETGKRHDGADPGL